MHAHPDVVSATQGGPTTSGPCRCTELAAVTERSVLAAGRFLGRGDAPGADRAASEAMVSALDQVAVSSGEELR